MKYFLLAERLLLTLWVGALWSIGYLAVPVLFATLDDRILAGALAGHMFHWVNAIGLAGGGLLFALYGYRGLRRRTLLLTVMLVVVALGEFVLQPMMAALKVQGLAPGSAQATAFARLHGVASILYLFNSLCGLWLVLRPGIKEV